MKQDYIENQAKNQIQQSIKDALSGSSQTTKQERCKYAMPHSPLLGRGRGEAFVRGFGKGPPGRSRSPGITDHLFPEHPPDHCPANETHLKTNLKPIHNSIKVRQRAEIHLNTEYQIVIKTQLLQPFKFFIMKKQILFLAFLVLAAFASVNKSYGQDLDYIPASVGAPVTTLPCATEDHLHPLPGKIYTYSVTVNPGVSTGNVQWFVADATTNTAVITAGAITATVESDGGTSLFLLDAVDANYNKTTGNTSGSIDVSWQSFDGAANDVLLVALVEGEGGCSDNVQVWRIEPSFAFTLDIAGLLPTGALPATGDNAVECLSPVQSATYDGTNLTMDYGDNYVYFTVTAANFVHSWQPIFTLTNNTETTIDAATDITWAYPTEAIKTTLGTWNAVTAPVLAVATSGAVGAAGEHIVVRVYLDHNNTAENNAAAVRNIILGVDAKMYNATGANYTTATLQDLDPSASGSPCTTTVTDAAQYDLTPRPQITELTPTTAVGPFEPKN